MTCADLVEDSIAKWGAIARKEFAADGITDGWEDAVGPQDTPEEAYIKVLVYYEMCSCNGRH